ncbi:DUF3861 family protein [Methylophaga sulfidovorans]|uniref:DUF3861 domain-containing protein n=1 Tax=Methylophaga sulfidovorans TaxID=45496 RepID=A0A1I3Z8A8_9GAMM|nr:DUF3861 family protein [Methylophaga sulfidovorans]SFK40277.1 protein of unknown function [Methylophaga sulfidovorans]
MNKPMRVTLQPVINQDSNIYSVSPISFYIDEQDELFLLAERLQQRGDFNAESAASFALGLKLLSDVMAEKKHKAIFSDFQPFFSHFLDLIKQAHQQEIVSHCG